MNLSQYGINANSTGASIPGLDGLQNMLGTITVVSVIIGGLFVVLYAINVIQRIRADRAMIAMHKDIAAIKEIIEKQVTQPTPHPQTVQAPTPQQITEL